MLSSLARRVLGGNPRIDIPPDEEPPSAPAIHQRGEFGELEILVSERDGAKAERFAQLLSVLPFCCEPLSFELVGTKHGISVLLSAAVDDLPRIRDHFASFFPRAIVTPKLAPLVRYWHDAPGEYAALCDFVLAREFMRPLGKPSFDPYVGLVGALGGVTEGEIAIFQTILAPVSRPWAEHAIRAVSFGGRSVFANAPELLAGAQRKFESPLYAVCVRALCRAQTATRVEALMAAVDASLRVFDGDNRLVAVAATEDIESRIEDVLFRETHRSGMVLSADEVTGIVHLPSAEVLSPRLIRQVRATRAAPPNLTVQAGVVLGQNEHAGVSVSVHLDAEMRTRHMHVIGASGTGKSTLLYNLIRQDIEAGRGVGVIDPHGDLVDSVLGAIPKERLGDVVLVDPADPEYAVGFNILRAHSELEKTILASDLVSVFERLSTSWGDQMGSVLSNAVLAFLESSRGGSLLDLRRFLVEPAFRAEFLKSVADPEVAYYWRTAFPLLTGNKSVGPILTRLDAFLAPKAIRHMVGQKESRLDFADIMDSGKIFLAKLSQGAIGRENSHLLGSLLFSKFQQLSVARQAQDATQRRDFVLYADEFQNFVAPSVAEILSGGRKYRLALVLAHQELRQLEKNKEVASAVMGNAATRVVFRVGDDDARTLAAGFAHFEATDIQSLGTGEAICRVEKRDGDFNLAIPMPQYPCDQFERAREVASASQQRYGTRRVEIDAALQPPTGDAVSPPQSTGEKVAEPASPKPVYLPPTVASKKPRPFPAVEHTPGRGRREHKYFQAFIKQWAEGMGWRATVEAAIPNGTGSVDVLLSKTTVTVACEISVTTSPEHEVGNLVKCLSAGFTHVISVSADAKNAREIRNASKDALAESDFGRVMFCDPRELFAFVSRIDAEQTASEATVKGYRVKVSYRPVDEREQKAKVARMTAVVARSLKRGKGGLS